ncbi:uncharacterized protein K452DRAFT_287276 [Aplosporella prunicola CBS 121167]|uniref:N-acetyltransferase B complex non catalytic subunit n=1 Tax=Aplosporella prunicola CBS 121167 TaxID=1176127 RepID=A0A6A6BCY8_9PEZI|nr:uncharacterized protein K452DRAFT_287276 [Aplosporella prunicola CBS 121167]KAF2142072.1 hypothetical protein K452DRAFT_287276 [Aplosporella prunicola CBS 121167]
MAALSVGSIDEKVATSGTNIKQALKDCTKKLQKRPKDPYLLYWKAAVHLKFGKREEAIQQLEELCDWTPAITDPQLLSAVYSKLVDGNGSESKRQALWQNAFKSTKDSDTLITWFESAAIHDRWKEAQQALVVLSSKFPKDEHYLFSLPAVSQLAADVLQTNDQKMSQFYTLLSYKKLSAAVTKAMKGDKSVDAVTTRRELRLVLQIYLKQGRRKEVLEILDDPIIGLFSQLVLCDLSFVRMKIEVLLEEEMWQQLWDFCVAALKGTHSPDEKSRTSYDLWQTDYILWKGLHASCNALLSQDMSDDAREQLRQTAGNIHEQHEAKNRRARLLARTAGSLPDQDALLESCCSYFQGFSKERYCFDDLRPYIEMLESSHQAKFEDWYHELIRGKDQIQDGGSGLADALRTEVTACKIDYLLSISTQDGASKERLETFAQECIKLLKRTGEDDYASQEDICALAVMTLVKLHETGASQEYLVQAEILMRQLLSTVGDSRKAGLLQARLVSFLGNFSEAMQVWSGLRIKEVLSETLGHHMFTRVSITHPFPYTARMDGRSKQDPINALEKSLKTATTIIHRIDNFMGADLEAMQYDRLLEIADFKAALTRSMSYHLLFLERRRIQRLRGLSCDDLYLDLIDGNVAGLIDSRDTQRLWNYEHSKAPRFENLIASGPLPGRYWIALYLFIDDTCALISSPESSRIHMGMVEGKLKSVTSDDDAELTTAEKSVTSGWKKLRTLATMALLGEKIEGISEAFEDMKAWLSGIREDTSLAEALKKLSIKSEGSFDLLPLAPHVQPMFLIMELLQACMRFSDAAFKIQKSKSQKWHSSIPKKEIAGLQSVAQDLFQAVRQRALDWTNKLTDGASEDLMKHASSGAIGEAMEGLLGSRAKPATAETASMLVQGALATLDGVLQVKLESKQSS